MTDKKIKNQIEKVRGNLNILEEIVNSTITQLNSQNGIMPIQPINQLFFDDCRVRKYEDIYHNSIRLYVPKDCITLLNQKGLGIMGNTTWGYYDFNYNCDESRKKFFKVLDAIEELDQITDKENIRASEINAHTSSVILKMLNYIGIPTQKYDYPSSRSKKKVWVSLSWTNEIPSAFKTYSSCISIKKEALTKAFDNFYNIDQNKRKESQDKLIKENERKETERQLAFMLAKYGLNITSDWDSLLNVIISKNKYLYLAHYLRLNRGDWNDGYSYAETGLAGFDIKTEQDREIYDEINIIITTYDDVDGRYFRDCSWSYDVLFRIVSEQDLDLFNDYQKASKYISNY